MESQDKKITSSSKTISASAKPATPVADKTNVATDKTAAVKSTTASADQTASTATKKPATKKATKSTKAKSTNDKAWYDAVLDEFKAMGHSIEKGCKSFGHWTTKTWDSMFKKDADKTTSNVEQTTTDTTATTNTKEPKKDKLTREQKRVARAAALTAPSKYSDEVITFAKTILDVVDYSKDGSIDKVKANVVVSKDGTPIIGFDIVNTANRNCFKLFFFKIKLVFKKNKSKLVKRIYDHTWIKHNEKARKQVVEIITTALLEHFNIEEEK